MIVTFNLSPSERTSFISSFQTIFANQPVKVTVETEEEETSE
jgi:hypothetical protein